MSSGICIPCGRGAGDVCPPCLQGNPPPEKVVFDQEQRDEHAQRRLEKLLGQARADLAALPDLVAELTRCLTERNHDVSGHHKVIGSPAPLNLPVVHLTSTRHKPTWHGDDPRFVRIAERYGVTPALESWVRVLVDERRDAGEDRPELAERATVRTEVAVLLEHWSWISRQKWAEDLARDIRSLAGQVKSALGIRPMPRYACPECGNAAYIQPGGILACVEVAEHHVVVRDLEQQMRRRVMATTQEIVAEFGEQGVSETLLRQWKFRRKITPARTERGRNWWFPWDVFCLLNPEIAEAVEARDALDAS